jgi:hypothetical protein
MAAAPLAMTLAAMSLSVVPEKSTMETLSVRDGGVFIGV